MWNQFSPSATELLIRKISMWETLMFCSLLYELTVHNLLISVSVSICVNNSDSRLRDGQYSVLRAGLKLMIGIMSVFLDFEKHCKCEEIYDPQGARRLRSHVEVAWIIHGRSAWYIFHPPGWWFFFFNLITTWNTTSLWQSTLSFVLFRWALCFFLLLLLARNNENCVKIQKKKKKTRRWKQMGNVNKPPVFMGESFTDGN